MESETNAADASVNGVVMPPKHGDIQSKFYKDGTQKICQYNKCYKHAEVRVYVDAINDVYACNQHAEGLPVHFILR